MAPQQVHMADSDPKKSSQKVSAELSEAHRTV